MAADKPNKTSIEEWDEAWKQFIKFENYPYNEYIYSGLLKKWIDPKTGEPVKENKDDWRRAIWNEWIKKWR